MISVSALTANAQLSLANPDDAPKNTLTPQSFVNGLAATVQVQPAAATSVYAGNILATFGSASFIMYCVDLFSTATLGTSTLYKQGLVATSPQSIELSKLFTADNGAAANGAVNSAALQLAIWEVLYDPNPISVLTGSFTADVTPETATRANWLLNQRATVTPNYQLTLFTDMGMSNNQDFISATPIPEPSMLLMLGLGLVAVTALTRVKK